jgi:hypothetical protein
MQKPFLVVSILMLTSCGAALSERRDWRFVQAVGGMAVEQPVRDSRGWALPVRINVSGTRAITVEPTLLNSALACDSVQAVIDGRIIYLTVVTRLVDEGSTAVCPAARLGQQQPGVYSVMYRSPDMAVISLQTVNLQ